LALACDPGRPRRVSTRCHGALQLKMDVLTLWAMNVEIKNIEYAMRRACAIAATMHDATH